MSTSYTVGTIQSIESFTPPFTATAVVEGTVSRGHTFGFAIASTNASSGVAIIGNLNSTDCSSLGNCGDPATCGISANPTTTPSNQCYYGIFARIANEGGHWKKVDPKLDLTPSVGVYYTLQISVDASGSAQYSLSQGGHVINESTAQVGSGPFYITIEQGEGAPVPGHGPNQAYWMSVSLNLGASTSPTSPGPSLFGISVDIWIVVVIIIIIILFLMILLWYRRRRLTVTVRDSQKLSPIPRATVSANGPVNLSGTTENNGQVVFTNPKKGDYSIQAIAAGYNPSIPVTVSVKKTIEFAVRLDRIAPGAQEGVVSSAPSEGPGRDKVIGLDEGKASLHGSGVMAQSPSLQTQQPQTGVTQPTQQGSAPAVTQTESASSPSDQQGLDELEGWGGERIRQIIRTFQMKGAISPETALTAQELGLSRLFVRIMKRRKGRTRVFVEINGRYYLNQKALQEMK
ncbi:MAG: carboxypeptidase-like regulatory domain-containing protein [Nitrososphaerales archaeon]